MDNIQRGCEALLDAARNAMAAGRLDEAARRFAEVHAQNPRSPWGLIGSGDVEWRRRRHEKALEKYVEAQQVAPNKVAVHLRIGRALAKISRFDDAILHFKTVLDVKPLHGAALFGLAEAEKQSGRLIEATEIYDRLAQINPDDIRPKLRAARLFLKIGRFDDADLRYSEIIDNNSESYEALVGAGDVAQARGDYAAAASRYRQAQQIRPDDGKLSLRVANVLRAAGRLDAAQSAVAVVVAKEAASPGALRVQTRLLSNSASIGSRRELLRRSAEAQDKNTTEWARLARFSADHDGLESGLAVLDEAEAKLGRDPKLSVARAEIYFKRGLDDAGEATLSSAQKRFPDSIEVLAKSIVQDIAKGRFDDAKLKIERYPERTRSQRLKRLMLVARLDERLWRIDEAAMSYLDVTRLAPSHVQAHRALARVEVLRMRPLNARTSLQAACKFNRGSLLLAGRATNASQGLVGEFVNELHSDPPALERARTAYERRDVGAALRLVREAPESTGAATTLFILLRRCGLFDTIRPSRGVRTIPHRIVQFWDSVTPPEDVIGLMSSWAEHNPNWFYQCYSNETASKYILSLSDLLLYRAWRSVRSAAQRADLFRLAVLAHEGGVYADADDRCTGALDAITERPSLLLWQEHYGSTGNNFVAVAPGHPVIKMALSRAVRAILRGDGESIWFSTGRGLLTRCAAGFFAESDDPLSLLNGELRILDQHELKAVCSPGCMTSYKTTRKHWMKAEFSQMAIERA